MEGLLEREPVLVAQKQMLDDAQAGKGGALFVVAEAGLGKSSVLERAVELADADFQVGEGCGEEMEQMLPFGLLGQTLHSLDADFLHGQHGAAEPAIEPSAPYLRLLNWIGDRRGDGPLLLAFDDLHWADEDSLSLIAFLVRRLARFPVALIATMRPWPTRSHDVCRGLVEAGHGRIERLRPLSRGSASALLADRSGRDLSDASERDAWDLCGGNPLLIGQLAMALNRGEEIPGAVAGVPGLGANMLLARFVGLDAASLECARCAGVLGVSFRPELAAEVAGLEESEVGRTLEALFRSGLVVEGEGGHVRFAHPLFAQAMYEDLAAPVRRSLHRRFFELLAERGLDQEAAEHAMRADLVGEDGAALLLERTGRAALDAGAVAVAVRHLEAADHCRGDRVDAGLLLALAEALLGVGRVDDAAHVCERALAEGDLPWTQRIAVLQMLGRAHLMKGEVEPGARALDGAVESALEHDPMLAVQPLLDQSLSAWLADGPEGAFPLAVRARELSGGAEPALSDRARAACAHLALVRGDPAAIEEAGEVEQPVRERAGVLALDPVELAWPWSTAYQFAMSANYLEHYEESQRAFTEIRDAVERADAANAMAGAAAHIANIAIRRGLLQEALDVAVGAAEFSDLTPGVLPYIHLVRGEALLWLGRSEEAEGYLALAEKGAPHAWFARLWIAHVRGLRLLWDGDARASDLLLEAERVSDAAGIDNPNHMHWAGHAIAAHLLAGRDAEAARLVVRLEERAEVLSLRWPRFAAALGRARLAERAGDDDAAEAAFRAAPEILDGVELPLQRVEGLLAHGSFLRRHGGAVDSRASLREAVRLAEECGARPLAEAAAGELRLAGGRRRRSPADRDRLTAAELRVAREAAAGHTNAEIARRLYLSENTIETHLKRVFAKLGIRSRRQLAGHDLGADAADPV
jgi:DNA-binding CsgD family transcriptional regulator/DNA-binding transcriptional ArsR family regulator